MAKDGTMRGGSRPGSGKKRKSLAERVVEGKGDKTVVLQVPSDLEGADMPPVKEFMKQRQKGGEELCAEEVYIETWNWLRSRGCEKLVSPQLIQQYAMSVARWVSVEIFISQTGYLARHPTTGNAIASPYVSMSRDYTWTAYKNEKRIVWRCINRLEYGKRYCQHSPTLDEKALQDAVARAVNRFISEDEAPYLALMKATIVEAIGLDGDGKKIDLLERRIDALNQRMFALVNESVQSGEEVKDYEEAFKDIADEIEQLKRRIAAIRESACQDQDKRERLEKIQKMMESKSSAPIVYDDAIIRQMIECIKVFDDKRLLIIFGGGYEVEETVANR